eukprot:1147745-Pelagomonas_calceolata.AAC.2
MLGLTKEKALKLSTKIHYHAVKTLTKITSTNMPSNLAIQVMGEGGGSTGRAAYRRARRKPKRMADNLPDPH